eukprot:3414456-Rhodomonas_salina.1
MYAGGRAAQLGQQFRDLAFVSGYRFGLDDVVSTCNFSLCCEWFVHPIPYGPDMTSSAPFPCRAGTSFVNGLAMSARDNSSPDLRRRPSHSVNVKPKFFADGSVSNFNSSSPDLSTIVEESLGECCFPDDPGQLSIDIYTEVFTRPGKPVRGGGDTARAVVKKIVGAVTPIFIFIIMSCFSWFSTAVDAFSAVVSSVPPIRAPHTLSFFSMVLVAIMLLSLLAPVASSY